jgi:hypothetical protein
VAYNGEVSAALSPSITAAQLESRLEAFNGIDNVTVTGRHRDQPSPRSAETR